MKKKGCKGQTDGPTDVQGAPMKNKAREPMKKASLS
jgi:hypothetical protein